MEPFTRRSATPFRISSFILGLLVSCSLFPAMARDVPPGAVHAPWRTAKFRTIYSFDAIDGASPLGPLIRDKRGNLFGVTYYGGSKQCGGNGECGTAFELLPKNGGKHWAEKVLHNFGGTGDGFFPVGQLVLDKKGNLYGATVSGDGFAGTVFKLSFDCKRGWVEEILYEFGYGNDGALPNDGPVMDKKGNLYGTTWRGGAYDSGTVWELSPGTDGDWHFRVLHTQAYSDGAPAAGLSLDCSGNLWGTTYNGGSYGYGTVFELTPGRGRGWTYHVIHEFDGTDGWALCCGRLALGKGGQVFGTTEYGGGYNCRERGRLGCGTVFGLTPSGDGSYRFATLYEFGTSGINDGYEPVGGLRVDKPGHLYGTTLVGGRGPCEGDPGHGCGVVFELTHEEGGWKETIVHNFDTQHAAAPAKDGEFPRAGLSIPRNGHLYGTTEIGGTHDYGTVFEITP